MIVLVLFKTDYLSASHSRSLNAMTAGVTCFLLGKLSEVLRKVIENLPIIVFIYHYVNLPKYLF